MASGVTPAPVVDDAANRVAAQCCGSLVAAGISLPEANSTAALFKALADPTRVRIMNLLANSREAICVCDLNEQFELSQPTMSHHLKKLVSAGLLVRQQRGTWAYYSVNDVALHRLAEVVETKRRQP